MNSKITLSITTLQQTVQYLSTKPYKEVRNLFDLIDNDIDELNNKDKDDKLKDNPES